MSADGTHGIVVVTNQGGKLKTHREATYAVNLIAKSLRRSPLALFPCRPGQGSNYLGALDMLSQTHVMEWPRVRELKTRLRRRNVNASSWASINKAPSSSRSSRSGDHLPDGIDGPLF
jgi:hypothetical protein